MRIPLLASAIVAMLALASGSTAADPSTAYQRPVALRERVTISDDVVRLGDLFGGVGDLAGARVGSAPAPGRRIALDAGVLYRIAQAHGLDWRPRSPRERVVLERDSVVVDSGEIERHVLAALADEGIDAERVTVEFADPGVRLHLATDAEPTVAVERLAYDRRSGRFSAVLTAGAGGRGAQPLRVSGRLHEVTEVPVLAQRVTRGGVISANDVEWLKVRSEYVPANAILAADELVGLSPKRTLQPGQPVRASEVQRPIVVPKGGLVTLVLTTPGMHLTARGRALEDGGVGDVIRVANAQNHTLVEGVVSGTGQVTMRLPGAATAN